jgi:peroxiredoxin
MTEPITTLTQEETEFQAKYKADSELIRTFDETVEGDQDKYKPTNPRYRLAPEYFQIYLEKRPSKIATQALRRAFRMWSRLKGVSGQVREALKHISNKEDSAWESQEMQEVWDAVGDGIRFSFLTDGQSEQGLFLLEELAQRTASPRSRATLLREVARAWAGRGEINKARRGFEQILELDTRECAWYVEHDARGYLYEFDCLNIGQPAPHFAIHDIDGNFINLEDYRGRIVLLDFWASWCGPCHGEFAHLRKIYGKYLQDRFVLIGVSLDEDFVALRQCIVQEKLHWPQICEGKKWHDPLAKLFNITGIPTTYVLDQQSHIAFKHKCGQALEEALDALLA